MLEFGERLKQLRVGQGYTQQKLADALGVSKSAISMYENGVREPELALIQKMTQLFGVELECLIGNSSAQSENTESPFMNMKRLLARNGNNLSDEERKTLIELLTNIDL